MRRGVIIVALGALLAGCGSTHRAAQPTRPARAHVHRRCAPQIAKLVVTVLDGDRRVRVRGARVRLAHKSGRTNAHGQTVIKGPRRRLVVEVSRRGYTPLRALVNFQRRHQTLRIYQPQLQWPIYGATPSRTQAQPAIKLRPPFRLVWSRGMGNLIEFPAVVWDGVAYVGNLNSTVRAVLMRDGTIAWSHLTPGGPRMASSPAVYDNEVVYHTMGGWVYVLDRVNGKLLWSWNAGSAVESSPIVRNGIDYFGTAAGNVDALDLRTHRLRWSRYVGAKITSSASIAGGRLFIGDYAGRLWVLRPWNGSTRWIGRVNGKIYGTPAVSQGRVFVPSSDGDSMTAFTTSGRYLWRVTTSNYVYSSPAVWHGRVFFGSYDGSLYSVSAATGRVLWRVWVGGSISGAAVVIDGVAYAGSTAHRVVGVSVRTGRRLLIFPHGDFVPVSGNGMRLLLNGFSRLYAVEPRHKLPRPAHRQVSRSHRQRQQQLCAAVHKKRS